ncbi:hypothetical protein BDR06DRAFT_951356 [Suillus hirtellus]|nr:hypothetical protein BDR06DRAFT_951356 [Suillus hirtellus]
MQRTLIFTTLVTLATSIAASHPTSKLVKARTSLAKPQELNPSTIDYDYNLTELITLDKPDTPDSVDFGDTLVSPRRSLDSDARGEADHNDNINNDVHKRSSRDSKSSVSYSTNERDNGDNNGYNIGNNNNGDNNIGGDDNDNNNGDNGDNNNGYNNGNNNIGSYNNGDNDNNGDTNGDNSNNGFNTGNNNIVVDEGQEAGGDDVRRRKDVESHHVHERKAFYRLKDEKRYN